jgi:hypothetical protein
VGNRTGAGVESPDLFLGRLAAATTAHHPPCARALRTALAKCISPGADLLAAWLAPRIPPDRHRRGADLITEAALLPAWSLEDGGLSEFPDDPEQHLSLAVYRCAALISLPLDAVPTLTGAALLSAMTKPV